MIHRTNNGVWMASRHESVSRMIAEDAMDALGMDLDDFRVRDKLILGIRERVNRTLDEATSPRKDGAE